MNMLADVVPGVTGSASIAQPDSGGAAQVRELVAALAAAKAELDTMAANGPGILSRVLVDPDGVRREVYISPNVEAITGLTVAQAKDPAIMAAHGDPGIGTTRERAFASSPVPGQATYDTWFRHVDGRILTFRVSVRRAALPDGGCEEIVYALDITAKRAAQAAARAAETRVAQLAERSPSLLVQGELLADGSYRLDLVGPNIKLVTGYDTETYMDLDCWAALAEPGALARWKQALALAMAEGVAAWEHRLRQPDNSWRTLSATLRLHGWDGSKGRLTWSITNVTRERTAEQALRQARADLGSILAAGPGVVLRVVYTGIGPGQLSFFESAAIERQTGFTEAEASLSSWFPQNIDPAHSGRLLALRKAILAHEPHLTEVLFRTRHKGWRWLQLSARPETPAFAGVASAILSVVDITERKALDARLAQSARLATLGELATSMAHELNQPLSIISMAAQNALHLGGKETAFGPKLERIVAQAHRASALIEHLRVFGRGNDAEREPVALREAVEGALMLGAARVRHAGLDVELDIPAGLPPARANLVLVEQVLLNLMANACDAYATQPDGPRPLHISARSAAGRVVLAVRDRAGGIAPDAIERMFEPFFTTKPDTSGTGVGLSFSYGVIADMGGTLTGRNEDGGAVFEIDLPQA